MIETQAYGYSSESAKQELSNEYQHARVWRVFKNICILVLWAKVDSALEGLRTCHFFTSIVIKVLKLQAILPIKKKS